MLCTTVVHNDVHTHTHTYELFLKMSVGLGLGLFFVHLFRFGVAFSACCLQCFDTVGWVAGRASGL